MDTANKNQSPSRKSHPESSEIIKNPENNQHSINESNVTGFIPFYIKNFIRRNNIAVSIGLLAIILGLILLAVLKNWVGLLLVGTSGLISFSCRRKNAFQKNTLQEKFITGLKWFSLLILISTYIWLVSNIDFWIGSFLFSPVVILGVVVYFVRAKRTRKQLANQVRYTINRI